LEENCNKLSYGNGYIAGTFTTVLPCAYLLDCTVIQLQPTSQLRVLSQVMFCNKESGNFFDFLSSNSSVKTPRPKSQ